MSTWAASSVMMTNTEHFEEQNLSLASTKQFFISMRVNRAQINFNKVFYEPQDLPDIQDILKKIESLDTELKSLKEELSNDQD